MADGVGIFWIAESGTDGALGCLAELIGVEEVGWKFFHREAPETMEPQSGICMP